MKLFKLLFVLLLICSTAVAQPTGGGSSGGGGGDASAANQSTMITNQGTMITNQGDIETLLSTIDTVLDTMDSVLDGIALDQANAAADLTTIASDSTGIETLLTNAIDGTTNNVKVDIKSVDQPTSFSATENHATAQTNNELVVAPGASVQLCITDIVISNGATAGEIKLVENTGSAVDILETVYVGVNGGAVINLTTPVCLTANTNLGFTSTTVTTHSVTVTGFQQ